MAAPTRPSPPIGIEPREVDLTPIRSRSLTLNDRAEMSAFFREQQAKNDGDPVVLRLRQQLALTKERSAVTKQPTTRAPAVVGAGSVRRGLASPESRAGSISVVRYASQVAVKPIAVRAAAANKVAPAPKTTQAGKAALKPKRKK